MVREVIADPSISLYRAAVAGAAGDKPVNPSEFLSDELVLCRALSRQRFGINSANHVLINANDELVIKACRKT